MTHSWLFAFALIYLTFFLDNVLLTVLVPIIPEWIRGEAEWARGNATGAGGAQAAVGAVLAAKAGAQLACAAPAAAAVCRAGPARVLRVGTALLLLAALVLSGLSVCSGRWRGAGAGVARAAQGAGAALAGVAGLALAARAAPPRRARPALSALLGAVALGVLVGYPFGGATYALWTPAAPFLIISLVLLADVGLQYKFLDQPEYNEAWVMKESAVCARAMWREARRGAGGACAGAVLLTTAVMAALEPCLPLWIEDKFHPQRWVGGAVFVPDSLAYLVSASALGAARGGGALAVAGVLAVGSAALLLPYARSVRGLAGPHALLGLGLGATDAALVPALLAPAAPAPARAALLQAAASAAYVIGPVAGGVAAWGVGFESAMRALGVLNVLYAAHLHRALRAHPLEEWDEPAAAPLAASPPPRYSALP